MRTAHRVPILGMLGLMVFSGSALAQHRGHPGHGLVVPAHPGLGRIGFSAAVSGGYGAWMPYYAMGGPGGYFWYSSPGVMMAPGGFAPGPVPGAIPVVVGRGPLAPPPPPELIPADQEKPAEPKLTRKDPARSAQLVVVGDRLFRGKNFKKAEERYLQASRLDAGSAGPQLRLAQVALVREQYTEAASRLRAAETAQPGWIVTAPDVQSLYGEPGEFADHLARLESYLQIHPDDRDGWLVLGAEWYLSGRAARASDVFLRLDDPRRKPDLALAAFLRATNQH
jgi:hypothetical protein